MQYETAADAARRLNLNTRTIQRLANDGKVLGAIRHGRGWLIPKDFKPNQMKI